MVILSRFAILALLIPTSSAFAPSSKVIGNNVINTKSTTTTTTGTTTTFLRMSDSTSEFDFDVAIIGCGVGGHGAALHSRAQSLKTAVFSGEDVGGTCVNRGW